MKDFHAFAAIEKNSLRKYYEKPHEIRSEFDRDRDRILYSKAFRRLSGKTQVFVVGNDDHIRTRLTHTLEVAQIANTISKYLGLNETLTEAIALGHDIGHTPFGHVGERTLNFIMNGCYNIKDFNKNLKSEEKGFKHNWQGIRAVIELEQLNKEYFGLNLTNYTLWGILNHSNLKYKPCSKKSTNGTCNLYSCEEKCSNEPREGFVIDFYNKYISLLNEDSWTLEGLVVAIGDEIAQRHHDIEDGIEAKIIDIMELMEVFQQCFENFLNESDLKMVEYIKGEKEKIYYLPAISKLIVNFLTFRLLKDTVTNLNKIKKEFNIQEEEDFYNYKLKIREKVGLEDIVGYSKEFRIEEERFRKYLKSRILNSYKAQSMDGKADYIIRKLFKAYTTNPQQLPDKTIATLYRNLLKEESYKELESSHSSAALTGILRDQLEADHFTRCNEEYKAALLRVICDYIAGMSDNYALEQHALLYGSKRME